MEIEDLRGKKRTSDTPTSNQPTTIRRTNARKQASTGGIAPEESENPVDELYTMPQNWEQLRSDQLLDYFMFTESTLTTSDVEIIRQRMLSDDLESDEYVIYESILLTYGKNIYLYLVLMMIFT